MTLRNQHVQPEDLFYFGDHLISTGKSVRFLMTTFFYFFIFIFGDHPISTGFLEITSFFWTKLQHFLRLFWTSQNRNSVIFELALGPLLVPGATDAKYWTIRTLFIAMTSLLGAREIRPCLVVFSDSMFLWISWNPCLLSLLLVWGHQAERIIVERLFKDATT